MLTTLIITAALAAPINWPKVIPGPYFARVERVVDGDTFWAEVQIWPQVYSRVKIRVRELDTWESRTKCLPEKEKGQAATRHLISQITPTVTLTDVRLAVWNRIEADVTFTDGRNLADVMRAAGHERQGQLCAEKQTDRAKTAQ